MTQPTNLRPEDIRNGVYLLAPDGVVFKAHGIEQTDIAPPDWDVHNDFEIYPLSECSGIPLNDAVLQAAGFTETKSQWYKVWNESGNTFALNKVEDWLEFTSHDPDLTELHLLQNLYRSLTRADLTINAAQLAEAVKLK